LKNDAVNAPTLSFKDRVTAVAINKALEFKLEAVGCASTGNLANSVAANAAAAGLPSFILIPDNLEQSKVIATQIYGTRLIAVKGNYDAVNRLCSQIVDRYPWGFVNVSSAAMPKAQRPSATKWPSTPIGMRRTRLSCRWPAGDDQQNP
jgi:threonine synthase